MEKKRIEDLDNNITFITKLKEENFTIKQKQVNYDQMLTKVRLHMTEFNLMRTQERVGIDPDKEKIQDSISQYEKKMLEELNQGIDNLDTLYTNRNEIYMTTREKTATNRIHVETLMNNEEKSFSN